MNTYRNPYLKHPPIVIGDVFRTTNGGEAIVTHYENCNRISVVFAETGTSRTVSAVNLRKGSVRDPLSPSVFNVGYNSGSSYVVNGKIILAGRKWLNMLSRCYDANDIRPCYSNTTVDREWHDFQAFKEWFDLQPNNLYEFDLDKDLLSFLSGSNSISKEYSSRTCTLLPPDINLKLAKLQRRLEQAKRVRLYSRNHPKLPAGIRYDISHKNYRVTVSGKTVASRRSLKLALDIYIFENIKHFIADLEIHTEFLASNVIEAISHFKMLHKLT